MTNPPPSPFARLRLHLAGIPDPRSTDSELVARYASTRDDAAFAELVRRHGPLVLAVCRRVTGNRDDADDAFQASFLVLARKPERVRPDSPLAAWLYGVAVRAARKAVARTARRRSRETPTPELPDVPDRSVPSDPQLVRAVLDEVARLPHAIRAAVVLCELEGRTRATAARELGVAEGTLSSRLAAARKVLARRFRDRGLAPAVFAAVAGSAACPVTAADAVRLVGNSASPDPRVELLSEAVMKTGFSVRWAVASAAAVVVSLGFALAGPDPAPAAKPVVRLQQPAPKAAGTKPTVQSPNKILFYRAGHLTLIDPDGKNDKKVSENRGEFHPEEARLSPDGKQLAVRITQRRNDRPEVGLRDRLYVRGLDEKEPGRDLGLECETFAWSPDGTEIAVSAFGEPLPKQGPPRLVSFVVNVGTREKTALNLPEHHFITDWSPDGKFFLTSSTFKQDERRRLHLMNRDGSEHKVLTDGKTPSANGRFSPDGMRVLFHEMERMIRHDPGQTTGVLRRDPAILDLATGKVTKVQDIPPNGDIQGSCWSPDGKRIAYAWREIHQGTTEELMKKETASFLVVCDADGKNAKTIATEKGKGQWGITIGRVDWR